MVEIDTEFPLWTDGGATRQQDWDLPFGLKRRLVDWARFLDEHDDQLDGWDTHANRDEGLLEGLRLTHDLRKALGYDWAVEFIWTEDQNFVAES